MICEDTLEISYRKQQDVRHKLISMYVLEYEADQRTKDHSIVANQFTPVDRQRVRHAAALQHGPILLPVVHGVFHKLLWKVRMSSPAGAAGDESLVPNFVQQLYLIISLQLEHHPLCTSPPKQQQPGDSLRY